MTAAKPRKITREMAAAETWLQRWQDRLSRESQRHVDRAAELNADRDSYIECLPDDVRAALVAAKVIE